MLDDGTVNGEGCFFGGVVCTNGCGVSTKIFLFAINSDPCLEPLPTVVHSLILSGVCRYKSSFLCWIHDIIVILITDGESIGIIH